MNRFVRFSINSCSPKEIASFKILVPSFLYLRIFDRKVWADGVFIKNFVPRGHATILDSGNANNIASRKVDNSASKNYLNPCLSVSECPRA